MIQKFFLADDDEDDCAMFREALIDIDSSLRLDHAKNGRELFVKLQDPDVWPEIIFLDVNMPEMNGWECLTMLKADQALSGIPVILYSTSSAKIYGKKAMDNGAIGFYEKPTSFQHFRAFLEAITETSQEQLVKTLKELMATRIHAVYTE